MISSFPQLSRGGLNPFGLGRGGFAGAIGSVYEWDADAATYLAAGEALDGQSLEPAVARAMNEWLFIAPKNTPAPIAATNWDAELAGISINMSGWRTLAAALLPLHPSMPVPTNVNFVQGDYSRTGGLKGDGVGKRISSNVDQVSLPALNRHLAVFQTEQRSASGAKSWMGTGTGRADQLTSETTTVVYLRASSLTGSTNSVIGNGNGLIAASREGNNILKKFYGSSGLPTETTVASSDETSYNISIFARGEQNFFDGRLSFASTGLSVDLTSMYSHLTSYKTALAAALA